MINEAAKVRLTMNVFQKFAICFIVAILLSCEGKYTSVFAEQGDTQSKGQIEQIDFFNDYVMPVGEIVNDWGFTNNGITMKWKHTYRRTVDGMSETEDGGFTTMPSIVRLTKFKWSSESGLLCYRGAPIPLNEPAKAVAAIATAFTGGESREECPIPKTIFIGKEWEDDLYQYKAIGFEVVNDNPITVINRGKKEVMNKYSAFVIERKMSRAEYDRWVNKPATSISPDELNSLFEARQRLYYVSKVGYVGMKSIEKNTTMWFGKIYSVKHNFREE